MKKIFGILIVVLLLIGGVIVVKKKKEQIESLPVPAAKSITVEIVNPKKDENRAKKRVHRQILFSFASANCLQNKRFHTKSLCRGRR